MPTRPAPAFSSYLGRHSELGLLSLPSRARVSWQVFVPLGPAAAVWGAGRSGGRAGGWSGLALGLLINAKQVSNGYRHPL
jgi:hypothetical protein